MGHLNRLKGRLLVLINVKSQGLLFGWGGGHQNDEGRVSVNTAIGN